MALPARRHEHEPGRHGLLGGTGCDPRRGRAVLGRLMRGAGPPRVPTSRHGRDRYRRTPRPPARGSSAPARGGSRRPRRWYRRRRGWIPRRRSPLIVSPLSNFIRQMPSARALSTRTIASASGQPLGFWSSAGEAGGEGSSVRTSSLKRSLASSCFCGRRIRPPRQGSCAARGARRPARSGSRRPRCRASRHRRDGTSRRARSRSPGRTPRCRPWPGILELTAS